MFDFARTRDEDPADAGGRGTPGRRTLTAGLPASRATARPTADAAAPPAADVEFDAAFRPDLAARSDADAFADATRGATGQVASLAQAERSLGQRFGDVPMFVGRQRELGALGAHAATDGRSVAFADAQPAADVVAHELVHVAQHRASGGGGTAATASADHPAEREADALAPQVAAGRPATVAATPGGLHRLTTERRQAIEQSLGELEQAAQAQANADAPLADLDRRLVALQTELRQDGTAPPLLQRVERVLTAVRRQRLRFAHPVPIGRNGQRVVDEHDDAETWRLTVDANVDVHSGREAPDGTLLATTPQPAERNAMQHTFGDVHGVADCHFVQFVSQGISFQVAGQTRWHAGEVVVERRAVPTQLSAPGAAHWYVDAPDDGTPFYDDNSLSRRTPTVLSIFDKPRTSFNRLNDIVDEHADVTIERMDVWWTFCTVLVRRDAQTQVFVPQAVSNWAMHTPVAMHAGFPDPGDSQVTDGEVMGAQAGWNQLQTALLAQYPNSLELFGIATTATQSSSKKAKLEASSSPSSKEPPRRDPPPTGGSGGTGATSSVPMVESF